MDARFKSMLQTRCESPASSIPKSAMGNRAQMKAAYRFLANDLVAADDMIQPHLDSTVARWASTRTTRWRVSRS